MTCASTSPAWPSAPRRWSSGWRRIARASLLGISDFATFDNGSGWMPSAKVPTVGGVNVLIPLLGSTSAGPNNRTTCTLASRLAGDPLGSISAPIFALTSSTNYNLQSTSPQRWGDMSKVDVDPTDAGFDAGRLARIDAHFARYVEDGRLPGWLAVVRRRRFSKSVIPTVFF